MKIGAEELKIGHILPYDVRDRDHTLLLRRGWVLGNEKEKAILLDRGSYWRQPAPELEPQSLEEGVVLEGADAFQIYDFLCARLDRVSREVGRISGFDGYVFDLIKVIRDALGRYRDPMMSNVMLGRFGRYSIRHSVDTAILVETMGVEAGMPVLVRNPMVAAALTMNISMLEMQDKLHSFPKALPDEVRHVMQSHAQRSVGMLKAAGIRDEKWLEAVAQHHERLDGSGYPARLTASEIAIEAQYVAAADSLLARMQPAAYRVPEMPSKLFSTAYEQRGTDLAGDAVSAVIKVLGCFPIGTLVRLRNGEMSVVVSRGANLSKPVVKSLFGELGMPMSPVIRDTAKEDFEILSVIDPARAGVAINRRLLWGS